MSETNPIDVRAMAIVHRTFRDAFDESARLVRAAPAPSAERTKVLADHVDFSLTMLRIHHDGEDELLYPKLIERVPDKRSMLEEIDDEHKSIATAIDDVSTAGSTWRRQPGADSGEALATALHHLNSVCQPHLDNEEREIVPLAAATLTQPEWDELGKHAVASIDRNQRSIAFGMILDPLDATDRAYMKKVLPAPVRLLSPIMIDRPWKKYADTLRTGT